MVNAVPLGVIDSLSEGFATVNRRLWVLLVPILLDLLLLAGPAISITPVAQLALTAAGDTTQSPPASRPQGGSDAAEEQMRALLSGFRDTNLMGVLAWQVPSVVGATATSTLPKIRGPVIGEVHSAAALVGQVLGLAVLGLLAASFYLAGLAGAVRREVFSLPQWAGQAVRSWARFLALYAGVILAALPILAFAVGLSAVLSLAGPEIASLVSALVGALVVTLAFYLYFADDAIVLTGFGPIRSVAVSAAVVSRHFGSSLGVFFLANLILLGVPLALRTIVEHPAGLVVASLSYAYVASGVTAGAMVFFYQRLTLWQQAALETRRLPTTPRPPD